MIYLQEVKEIDLLKSIINLIYPPVCPFCGKIDENFLCENCRKNLQEIEKVHLDKCKSKYYEEHAYMFKYNDIRDSILAYKFDDKPYYYKTFVNILLNNKKMCEILKSYDIIIPVPIHNKRRKERGYNQTELIAREIAKKVYELEYINILEKTINTVPQSTLSKEQRKINSKDIYKLKNIDCQKIQQKRVLIFDDIYTTGATANECAKVVKALQPYKIGILTIAKD